MEKKSGKNVQQQTLYARKRLLEHDQIPARGPGDVFELHSVLLDIPVISTLVPAIIGRPLLYLVTDQFSGMVVGLSVGVINDICDQSKLAILNAAENKMMFCSRYGIEIEAGDWPASGLCQRLIVESHVEAKTLEKLLILGVTVGISPFPGRAARPMHKIDQHFFHQVTRKQRRNRGKTDSASGSHLTIADVTKEVTKLVIEYNKSSVLTILSPELTRDDIKPIPIEVWNWGTRNKLNVLQSRPVEDLIHTFSCGDKTRRHALEPGLPTTEKPSA